MGRPVVRAWTIGQTPRPDLTADLEQRLPGTVIEVRGALDGLPAGRIPACGSCDYPLETRLRDGTRVVIDAAFVEDRLQRALEASRGDVLAYLLLCAGPFPALTPPVGPGGRAIPLIRPFETAVRVLGERGYERLAVLVPFEAQAGPAERKWRAAGFAPTRVRAWTEKPRTASLPGWIASWAPGTGADALVFDYVGHPPGSLDAVAAASGLPVIDPGHLALDALEESLHPS